VTLQHGSDSWTAQMAARYRRVVEAARTLAEVEAAEALNVTAYGTSNHTNGFTFRGRQIRTYANRASDGFADLAGLRLIAGRWFGPEDAGTRWQPVVINRRLAKDLYGNENPIGQSVNDDEVG